MRITIAERLRPYSHRPGIQCLLPGTSLSVQVFPTRIRFYDLLTVEPTLIEDISLDLTGPVKEFTVQSDLEKGHLVVWGHTSEGFIRYRIAKLSIDERIGIFVDKAPSSKLFPDISNPRFVSPVKYEALWHAPTSPRLSLGNNKAQEWERLIQKFDLKEILPLWLRAGFLTPGLSSKGIGETLDLLEKCKKAISNRDALEVSQTLTHLFMIGFKGLLVPRLSDEEFQGIVTTNAHMQGHALSLISEGSSLIQSMFFQQNKNTLSILPVLPGKFPSGRFIDLSCGDLGTIDIDWTKGKIRRIIFRSHGDGKVKFDLPKDLKKCRFRLFEHEKGEWVECPIELDVKVGQTYLFDKFQK